MATPPLEGKTALVTGGAVRVGRAIALALARAGADLVLHFRSSGGAARSVCDEIMVLGRRAFPVAGDLSDAEDCKALARQAQTHGGVDLLVHSAASFVKSSLEETDAAVWDAAMDLNARAGFLLARELAPALRQRRGRVVLIGDAFARDPVRGYLAHAVSKAALEGLVRALAVELAPEVRVNGVSPGTVLPPVGTPKQDAERWAGRLPLCRLGTPEDVAETVLFLCAGPDFLTGQVIRVDGGKDLT